MSRVLRPFLLAVLTTAVLLPIWIYAMADLPLRRLCELAGLSILLGLEIVVLRGARNSTRVVVATLLAARLGFALVLAGIVAFQLPPIFRAAADAEARLGVDLSASVRPGELDVLLTLLRCAAEVALLAVAVMVILRRRRVAVPGS